MEEEEDLGGVGVALGEGEEVEVVVTDVEVLVRVRGEKRGEETERETGRGTGRETGGGTCVDAFVRETWRYGRGLFFGFTEEDGELLDGGHGDIAPIISGKQGLHMSAVSKASRQKAS